MGISDNLIRLSVGLEDEKDLLADLQQALDKAVWLFESSLISKLD